MNKERMVAEIGAAVGLSPDSVGWRSAPRRAWIEAVYQRVVGRPEGRMSKQEMLSDLSRELGVDVDDGVAGKTSLYPSKQLVDRIHDRLVGRGEAGRGS